ncbi:MFS transporter [Terrilactibacillus sp. S3-3]|nr:MFS transporter [Terrilactibacillus sp. S3-3]
MDFISPEDRAFKKTLVALFLGSFIMYADLYSTQPVIPVMAKQFHVSPAAASLTLSFATGALAIFLFIVSFTSGMFDRKKIMALALVSSAFLSFIVGFIHSLPLLIAVRFVQGALLAGFPSIAMAYINEEFHKSCLGYVIGIYVSGNSVGGLAGRLIVGILSDKFSWNAAIGALGALSMAMSVIFILMLPKSRHFDPKKASLKRTTVGFIQNIKSPSLVLLYCLGFILMGSFVTVYNYIGIPLMAAPYHLSQTFVGFIFVIYLVGTVSSTWMGRIADHMDRSYVITICILLMAAGTVLTLSVPLVLKIIGLALLTFGFFGGHSVASSWVGLLANRREKAQASSLYLLFYYVGSSVIGSVGGIFLSYYGWLGIVSVIIGLLALGIVFSFSVRLARRHERTRRHGPRRLIGQH